MQFVVVLSCLVVAHVTGRSIRELDDEISLLERLLRDRLDAQEQRDVASVDKRAPADPNKFLEKFGYLERLPEGQQHDHTSRVEGIKQFQRMYNLKATGVLDQDTLNAMAAPRCGMPDTVPKKYTSDTSLPAANQLQAENYYVPGTFKWHKMDLSYHFRNFYNSPSLSEQTQRSAIKRALTFWSDVTPLRFSETEDTGDINFQFSTGAHQDGPQNAFDGPGGVLAHAFYPESGETHFDETENWQDSKEDGIDLMTVAAHELGHALGLGHSSVPGALMAPYYQGYNPNFVLPDDDKQAIQSLYGSGGGGVQPPVTVAPTTTTTKKQQATTKPTTKSPVIVPSGRPDTCTVVFQAVTQVYDGSIHVFNGAWLWRLTDRGLDPGYPVDINSVYERSPDNIDAAAYSPATYYTFLFKGNKVWKYYGFRLVTGRTINVAGYSAPKAAVTEPNGQIWLLKGSVCWLFDENALSVDPEQRSCDELFPNIPANIDSALRIENDPTNVFFFSGPRYYKYNEATREVARGYPKQKAGVWMGTTCGGNDYTPK